MNQQIFLSILGLCLIHNARSMPQVLIGDPVYDNEWDGRNLKTKMWCNKLHLCNPGGPKVCGWDSTENSLAEFESICVMYRANCRGFGLYNQVEMVVCETKKTYDKEHDGETFEWIHVARPNITTTTVTASTKKRFIKKPPTILPGQVQLVL